MMFNNHHNNTGRENEKNLTANRRISKAVIETLETRQLMSSANLVNGTLTLTGNTTTSNYLNVRLMDDGKTLEVKTNSNTAKQFDLASVKTRANVPGETSSGKTNWPSPLES